MYSFAETEQMKRVLITGAGSYIGSSLEAWLSRRPDSYIVETADTLGNEWETADFSSYDAIVHVAGIAHIRETAKNRALYFRVNRDLPEAVARKAAESGVGLFVFLSSMSVYGVEEGIISERTLPSPKTAYGKSKLEAEERIGRFAGPGFKVAVLRPPMVYGPGCKGNYPRLSRLIRRLPVFPLIRNERSMVYIDHLCEFIRHLIDANAGGCFFPQNEKPVETSDLALRIAKAHGKSIRLTRIFNPLIFLVRIRPVRKLFGNLVYDASLSASPGGDYRTCAFGQSIEISERYFERKETEQKE